jgi:hypothetical protein
MVYPNNLLGLYISFVWFIPTTCLVYISVLYGLSQQPVGFIYHLAQVFRRYTCVCQFCRSVTGLQSCRPCLWLRVYFFTAVSLPKKKFVHYNFLQRDTAVSIPAEPAVSCRVVYPGRKFPLADTAGKPISVCTNTKYWYICVLHYFYGTKYFDFIGRTL